MIGRNKKSQDTEAKIQNVGSAAKHFYDLGQHNYCELWVVGAPSECSWRKRKYECFYFLFILFYLDFLLRYNIYSKDKWIANKWSQTEPIHITSIHTWKHTIYHHHLPLFLPMSIHTITFLSLNSFFLFLLKNMF